MAAQQVAPVRSGVDGAGRTLELLRRGGPMTVSALAQAHGQARSTVQGRIDLLRESALVRTRSNAPGARGRPAVVVDFDTTAAVVLAAHVGLTGSRVAVTDLSGVVLGQRFVDVPAAVGPDRLLARLVEALTAIRRDVGRQDSPLAGVGVGLPGQLDLLTYARSAEASRGDGDGAAPGGSDPQGIGRDGAGWDGAGVVAGLQQHWDAPVFLDLDVNLLASAERRRAWPEQEVLVCVKLGTLIDAAIVVNGVPVRGASGLAGGLGHVKVPGSSAGCSCGGSGCLDAVASGSALVAELGAAGLAVDHVTDVVALVQQGHPVAVGAVRAAGRAIGGALASVVNLLNPGVITAWGYLTGAEAVLFAGIREGLYPAALPGPGDDLELVRTTLGDLTGVAGAAAMVLDAVLDPAAVDRMLATGSWRAAHVG